MEGDYKIVDFSWCNQCKYKNIDDTEDPCYECLDEPVNIDSHKPVYFEDKEV